MISFALKKALDNEYSSHIPTFINEISPFFSNPAKKGTEIATKGDIQETMSKNPMTFPKEASKRNVQAMMTPQE